MAVGGVGEDGEVGCVSVEDGDGAFGVAVVAEDFACEHEDAGPVFVGVVVACGFVELAGDVAVGGAEEDFEGFGDGAEDGEDGVGGPGARWDAGVVEWERAGEGLVVEVEVGLGGEADGSEVGEALGAFRGGAG